MSVAWNKSIHYLSVLVSPGDGLFVVVAVVHDIAPADQLLSDVHPDQLIIITQQHNKQVTDNKDNSSVRRRR